MVADAVQVASGLAAGIAAVQVASGLAAGVAAGVAGRGRFCLCLRYYRFQVDVGLQRLVFAELDLHLLDSFFQLTNNSPFIR